MPEYHYYPYTSVYQYSMNIDIKGVLNKIAPAKTEAVEVTTVQAPAETTPLEAPCLPMKEAIKKMPVEDGCGSAEEWLGDLDKWPCVCVVPSADVWNITCAKGKTWDEFWTEELKRNILGRICTAVRDALDSECVRLSPYIREIPYPLKLVRPLDPRKPMYVDNKGKKRYLVVDMVNRGAMNDCWWCQIMLRLTFIWKLLLLVSGYLQGGKKFNVNEFYTEMWQTVISCARHWSPTGVIV